jgi:hypothetical protein
LDDRLEPRYTIITIITIIIIIIVITTASKTTTSKKTSTTTRLVVIGLLVAGLLQEFAVQGGTVRPSPPALTVPRRFPGESEGPAVGIA